MGSNELKIIMITQQEADAAIEKASEEFKHLSYEELKRRTMLQESGHEEPNRQLRIAGETVYANTRFAMFGIYRKRVSVEMVLLVDSEERWHRVPCVYFERFESGRLYVPDAKKWERAAKPMLYASAIVLIASIAYFLHKFLNAE